MLRRIYIDNFRCFSNFEFRPERVNLLLGANGSGKTSLFDLVGRIVRVTRGGADISGPDAFSGSSLTRWDRRDVQRFELEVESERGGYLYLLELEYDRLAESSVAAERALARPSIARETVVLDGKTLFEYSEGAVRLHKNDGAAGPSFPFKGTRSFLAQIDSRPETRDLIWFLEFLSTTWCVRPDSRSMTSVSLEEEPTLTGNASNFASYYRHLSQESAHVLPPLWEALKKALPGFAALKLVSTGGPRARDLVVSFAGQAGGYDVDFAELSDGQRGLVLLYTLLLGPDHSEGALMLDEPEAHLSLREIQPWLVELDDVYAEEGGQLFVVSHHPEVVDYLASSSPWLFDRPNGGPVRVRRPDFDLGAGEKASVLIARGLVDGG